MLKHLSISLLLLCVAVVSAAQDFRVPWISCPALEPGGQAWFREVVVLDEPPAQAWLQVATDGYVQVYVNERNVTTAVRLPFREGVADDGAYATVMDIARFLTSGRNVVAIHYAPLSSRPTLRQVAAHLWGTYANGAAFSLITDEDWTCRPADARLNKAGDETIDSRQSAPKWNALEVAMACWLPAESHPMAFGEADDEEPVDYTPLDHTQFIVSPDHIIPTHEGLSCVFAMGFEGWVRVTLRNAKAGQRLRIDDTEYICRGQFDEQACPHFAVRPHRIVQVIGDEHFLPEQVFSIEGIAIGPRWMPAY